MFTGICFDTLYRRRMGVAETIRVRNCPSEETAEFAANAARARFDKVQTDRTEWEFEELLNAFPNIRTEIERRF